MTKLKVLEELLGEFEISDFSRSWIETSRADEDSIREVYKLLKGYGLSDKKIASNAYLLSRNPETIERNYQLLKKLGLSDRKIVTNIRLLAKSPESIERKYQLLKRLGLSDKKIASRTHLFLRAPETIERRYQLLKRLGLSDRKIITQAQLLETTPETIERNYQLLKKLGLSDKKIAIRAQLLSRNQETIKRNYYLLERLGLSDKKIVLYPQLLERDPKTIKKNYQYCIRLLRQDYKNRNSGRDLLFSQIYLLGLPSETIESNVQYLTSIDVKYNIGSLLGTKTQTKREKLAWMLRELFNYKKAPQEQKKDIIDKLYTLVRKNSSILRRSINWSEIKKDELREKINNYKGH